jgi:hypothetical protein
MTEMEQARRAGGSGRAFTAVVVLAIIASVGLFVWRAVSSEPPESPVTVIERR